MEARRLLNADDPMQPSQKEVAKALGVDDAWIWRYEMLHTDTVGMYKPFNIWNFAKCDDRFGKQDFKGRIPGQIIQNILYFFLENPNGKIVDPMAGSATTNDVCRLMNRKYLAYDLKPYRKDISLHNITEGFPEETKGCDLIFLDPPYYKKKEKE